MEAASAHITQALVLVEPHSHWQQWAAVRDVLRAALAATEGEEAAK